MRILSLKACLLLPFAALNLTPFAVAESVDLSVHTDRTTKTVDVGIYGQFLEHIFNSVHGGLWGDQVLNGMLELRPAFGGRGGRGRGGVATNASPAMPTATPPLYWEFVGDTNQVSVDWENPFNADVSVRIAAKVGGDAPTGPGIRQRNIALKRGEKYTLSLYARGSGGVIVTFQDGERAVFTKTITGLTDQWKEFKVEFAPPRTMDAASLTISAAPSGRAVNVDQISLFSASALKIGGYRPDLFKAVAELQPASIRWPGGSYVSSYVWTNAIGPREKRRPHPSFQWNDRDTYQFGTDEFIQFCEKVGAEPILVLNTRRGVQDALNWLQYCMGDANTEFGRMRAANGRAAPYQLKTIEIDNEYWRSNYIDVVKDFCPAIRDKHPGLKLSVVGSYGYDTGRGQGNISNWDGSLIQQAGKLFDFISPHYYNGIFSTADHVEDPRHYEQLLKTRADLIRNSGNPDIKVYVSEWNLTQNSWSNDWRTGLYAGGILNAFERQSDIVTMTCPALFLRKQGVTRDWNNALVNFDQKSWFPAGNYVVMKLWRDSFAPNLLAVDGPDHPLNFVATRSADQRTVFLKAVNPGTNMIEATIRFEGDFDPKRATMKLIAPGAETARNTLEEPNNIKLVSSTARVRGRDVRFNMPALSAGVVRVTP